MATVEATSDSTRVVQRVKKDTENVTYERSRNADGWTNWERVATGTDISYVSQKADSITAYVKNSTGSKTLASILSMDPNNSTIGQVVNGHIVSAINTSSDGLVKISGKNIELDGNTTVTGRLDLMQNNTNWVNQSTNYHNSWRWNNAHIYFNNYLQLLGENCNVTYTNTNTHLGGTSNFYAITTLTPGYLKFTTYNHKIGETDENFDGQISRTYIDSGRIETSDAFMGNFRFNGSKIHSQDNNSLYITNSNGTNFDDHGYVGLQVWSGLGIGQQTLYTPGTDLYVQQGNVSYSGIRNGYSSAPKTSIHCHHIVSQSANTVSSRLSVKTDITKVTYDRALAAVEGTEMYDYRYTSDETGQHYVSGIIDDINPEPQYHMDDMLINKDRTARIDANLIGYHHVVIQELIKKIDKLQTELKELKSKEK